MSEPMGTPIYYAECRICHLMIRAIWYGSTICDHCLPIYLEREVMREILDRQHERHYTPEEKEPVP